MERIGGQIQPLLLARPLWMARIAINAVIHVAVHTAMFRVRRRCRVATRALKDRIVVGIRVASAANPIRIAVIDVEERVKLRGQVRRHPCGGGVTCVAGRRPPRRAVIGVGGFVVVRNVAAGTDHGQAGVVIVHMAARARDAHVGAGERKGGVVVIKHPLAPSKGVVADLASRRKAQLYVIYRCYGIVVVGLMASNAGRAGQAVVVVDVAESTAHGCVRAGERPAGRGVIEGRGSPRCSRMTDRTIGGKPRRNVTGIVRGLKISSMTSNTCCVGEVEIIVHMARAARNGHVGPCKRKSRGVVIEVGLKPCIHAVARLAICRKATRDVIRRGSILKIPNMT